MELTMSRARQKSIVDAIVGGGFKTNEFEFVAESNTRFKLIYKAERSYYFNVYNDTSLQYAPGSDGKMLISATFSSWDTIITYTIPGWLQFLKAELAIGDPWSEIENIDAEQLNVGGDNQGFFTKDDVIIIDEKLDIILEALKEFDVNFQRIKDDLDYLKSQGNKVSKKDWGLMVMGSVMSWGIDNAVPKESLHDIWTLIVQTLGNQNLLT